MNTPDKKEGQFAGSLDRNGKISDQRSGKIGDPGHPCSLAEIVIDIPGLCFIRRMKPDGPVKTQQSKGFQKKSFFPRLELDGTIPEHASWRQHHKVIQMVKPAYQ